MIRVGQQMRINSLLQKSGVLLTALGAIAIYYIFVILNGFSLEEKTLIDHLYLIWSNIIASLLALSFFSTIFTDPGRVPAQARTISDKSAEHQDEEEQTHRYCCVCNNIKPERSHHCSVCNRCILNMDHHCPLLSVCIGFFNRKFFLLTLIYALVFVTTVMIYFLPTFLSNVDAIITNRFVVPFIPVYLTTIAYLYIYGFVGTIGFFLKTQIIFAIENTTTIENSERKRNPENADLKNYDIGRLKNFKQIFGSNPWFWFIPLNLAAGKPEGDGISWPTRTLLAWSRSLIHSTYSRRV